LGVSRSGYYAWRNRDVKADELSAPVTQVFWQHARRYGSRRIVAESQAQDYAIGRRRGRRIMKEQQLRAIQPKSFVPRTTDSRHDQQMSPNLLPGLKVSRPRQVLVSDITYLPLVNGAWAYLATWMDLYSRKVVGWQVVKYLPNLSET
jgi:transposase InsO family protein